MTDRYLRITLANHEKNSFGTVGGAGFETDAEWEEQWRNIPSHTYPDNAPWELLLDKMPDRDTWEDSKPISMETATTLLGITEEEVMARAANDVEQAEKMSREHANRITSAK